MKDHQEDPAIQQYLSDVSARLRGWRARRGMRRKDLATDSGVSERYLAQLENGDANPSLGVLLRLVNALDITPRELLVADEPEAEMHPGLLRVIQRLSDDQQAAAGTLLMRHYFPQDHAFTGVALVGLRGAGKSTLGEGIARELNVPFIRLGGVIERLGGMDLAELFSLGGQKAYRRLEREAVDDVIRTHPGSIVEAGGSLVSEMDTFNALRSAMFTVWVKADPEDHMNRVIGQGDFRPIRGSEEAMSDLRRILAEREPYYRASDYIINTSGRSVRACLNELVPVCRPYLTVQLARAGA